MRERQAPKHTYHYLYKLTDINMHTHTQDAGIKYKDAKTGALPVVGGPGFHLLDDDDVALFCMDPQKTW